MSDSVAMETLIEQEFNDDPLFQHIQIIPELQGDLFPDFLNSLNSELTYSAVELGKMINKNDSTIRNYFRTNLVNYIKPLRHGKFYRLDYKSVYRTYMILLLMDQGKTLSDIRTILGMEAPVVTTNSSTTEVSPGQMTTRDLSNFKQFMMQQSESNQHQFSNLNTQLTTIKDLQALQVKLESKKRERDTLALQKENERLRIRNDQLLIKSLKNNQKKKPSFWERLTGRSADETNSESFDEMAAQINIDDKINENWDERIKEVTEEIKGIEEEIKDCHFELEQQESKFHLGVPALDSSNKKNEEE